MNLLKRWKREGDNGAGATAIEPRRREEGLARFREEMNRMFERMWQEFERGQWTAGGELANWPALDMVEDERNLTLRVDVPGLGPEDVDVEVSGNLLKIRGSRQDEWSEQRGGVHRRERVSGSFHRSITLPSHVDPERIEARYEKGILTITAPKTAGGAGRKVQVKAE